MSRWVGRALLAALLVLGALNVVYVAHHWTALSQVTTPRGSLAPDVTLPTLAGGRLHLAEERGHPVVLVFWASWCGPCQAELPGVERVAEALTKPPHTTRLFAISTDAERADAERAVKRLGLTMPVALDDGSASSAYKVMTIPHTVLIGADGKIRGVLRGGQSEAALTSAIESLER